MSRRIDIELTSALSDGSWTWRAAGARNPKGTLDGAILPDGASVGDELKVEVEQGLDGIEILSVVRGREKSDRDLLELLPTEENFQAVIETRAKRGRSDRGGGREGRRGGGRDGGRRRGRDGEGDGERGRRDARGDDRRDRSRGQRRPHFETPPEVPKRPKPKRLKPGRERRTEVLAGIPEEQRGIAELALQGMPAVRTRLAEENEKLAAENKPTMPEASVLKMAEDLLPTLRVADWHDRADAAKRQMENLDLRDLRSVIAAGEDPVVVRDESTRAINDELKADLVKKQAQELKLWLEDVDAAIEVGRSIRALRLSSQPPKAGVMFPPELARKLGAAATAGLTAEDSPDRWAAVMEAAAFSPVRTLVTPTAPPSTISDDLRKTALRLGPLLPQIAALLGVDVPADAPRPKPLRPNFGKDRKKAGRGDGGRSDRGRRDARGRDERRAERAPNGEPRKDARPEAPAPAGDAPAQSAPPSDATRADSAPGEPTPSSDATPAESAPAEAPPSEGGPAEPTTAVESTPAASESADSEPAQTPSAQSVTAPADADDAPA